MKTLRSVLVLGFASVFFAVALNAADEKADKDKSPAGCDCAKDKDGKVCGVDKDCCCTGQKATKPEKKDEKKDGKKDDKAADKK